MSAWPHPIKAVIFDCDGTILDTLKIYFQANGKILGFTYPPEVAKITNGKGELDVCRIIVDHFKLDMAPEDFQAQREVILEKTLENAEIFPHVEEVIRKFKDMGMPMALATSSGRNLHAKKTKNHRDIFSLFQCEVCGSDVSHAKPSPEIFQLASAKLGNYKPENVLVFEDAPAGIKAANAAQMPVVVYHKNDQEFQEMLEHSGAKPTLVFDDYSKFDFSLFRFEP